ncbi:MAG TPA: diguanylate cyclase, partial [Acidobacteriota bacterium]|nr:diguanylate cyclase [Acidobacteriota bacterium]
FEAKSGLEGIKMLMDKRVDLVICDVVMPEFDGFKFLISKSTNPQFTEIPVIMLTSEENVGKKIKGLEQGASDYLTKPFDDGELLARVKVHLKIKQLQDELKEKNNRLRELSGTDELTKLANRRRFMEQFTNEFSRAIRYEKKLSFVILDVDFFKRVNDSHGHLAGDAVLEQLGQVMMKNMRKSDVLARYGGEEFTLLLPETGLKGSVIHAERIRKDIQSTQFSYEDKKIRITVSGGCASIPEIKSGTVDELVKKADEALYRAKNKGRNRIESAK